MTVLFGWLVALLVLFFQGGAIWFDDQQVSVEYANAGAVCDEEALCTIELGFNITPSHVAIAVVNSYVDHSEWSAQTKGDANRCVLSLPGKCRVV